MYFHPDERLAVFIDGGHLYSASRTLGFDVDYLNFLGFFRKQSKVVRAFYYAALIENGGEYSPVKPLTDWLAYNHYTVVTKMAKEYVDADGRRRVQGNMDLDIVIDMVQLAPRLDHIVLVSGTGGFRRPVEYLQASGVRVSIISSLRTKPPMVSDELRRATDQFIELDDIKGEFLRKRDREPSVISQTQTTPVATPADPFATIADDDVLTVKPAASRRRTAPV